MMICNAKALIGGKIVPNTDVIVKNGRIEAVGKNLKGTPKVDARGALLAPGFVDCTHPWAARAMIRWTEGTR